MPDRDADHYTPGQQHFTMFFHNSGFYLLVWVTYNRLVTFLFVSPISRHTYTLCSRYKFLISSLFFQSSPIS